MDTFIWYELMTPDVEGAKAFYAAVVGWTMSEGGQPGMPYTIVLAATHQPLGLDNVKELQMTGFAGVEQEAWG